MPPSSQTLRPMLAVRRAEPLDSPDHVFDLRWDGIRALAFIDRARLRLVSQSGREITALFRELAPIAGQVRTGETVLDGEIVAIGPDGTPDLSLLVSRLTYGRMTPAPGLVFQAFDLLGRKGQMVLDQPLFRRRELLGDVLRFPSGRTEGIRSGRTEGTASVRTEGSGPALVSDWVESDGKACFEAVAARRLPGMIAKEKRTLYLPGSRSHAWQDVRVYESGWFVVGGYLVGVGKEGPVAGLLLGEPDSGGRLCFSGIVEGGFPAGDFEGVLAAQGGPSCPFGSVPALSRLVYW